MPLQQVVLQQADGHPTVAFRPAPGQKSTQMLANGTTVMAVGREGEFLKVVSTTGQIGFVKARNAQAKPAAAAAAGRPASAPVAAAAKPVVSAKAQLPSVPTMPAPVAGAGAAKAATPVRTGAGAAKAAPAAFPIGGVCKFSVNGTAYTIDLDKDDIAVDMSAHDWIAGNVANSGSRQSCRQGRCGACVNVLTYTDAAGKEVSTSFNSCLRPILSCNGMAITTSRGIGSTAKPHPAQQAVADNFGTQCGFCSSGMVMNLYAQMLEGPKSAAELDNAITGNYCRCTGYRPILAAYRSMAADAGVASAADAAVAGVAAKKNAAFGTTAWAAPAPAAAGAGAREVAAPTVPKAAAKVQNVVGTGLNGESWVEVTTEGDLQAALGKIAQAPLDTRYFLVNGHTSKGIWPLREHEVYVNIAGVASLKTCEVAADGAGVWIGAGATMSATLAFLAAQVEAQAAAGAAHRGVAFAKIVAHGHLSPSNHIRNVGTIGGNLMIAYSNVATPFIVDWPMLLEAAGAQVEIVNERGEARRVNLGAAFYTDTLRCCYVRRVYVPYGTPTQFFATYRHSPRHVYSEAFVAAAFSCEIDAKTRAISSPRLVYNGLAPTARRVATVERAMAGVTINDEAAFQALLETMNSTVVPLPQLRGSVEFRKQLVLASFYKFFLAMNMEQGMKVRGSLQSAATPWIGKEITAGAQSYQEDDSVAPLNHAVKKIDGLKQCTAEAEYVQNIPLPKGTLYAAVVYAKKVGKFTVSDAGVADTFLGYRGLVSAKDAPAGATPVFADGESQWLGQPVALALATQQEEAVKAANAITVTYTNAKTDPITGIDEAIARKSFFPDAAANHVKQGDVDAAFANCDKVVEDTFKMNGQYHWHMETQSCLSIPKEDGIECHSATQMPPAVQSAVAGALNMQQTQVVIKNKRCGGGFGGKLAYSIPPAQVCAIAATARQQPIQLVMEYRDNMTVAGMRPDWRFNYKIGVNNDGTIQAVKMQCYYSAGAAATGDGQFEALAFLGSFDNCYNIKNWQVDVTICKTDLPATTSMRAPGWIQGIWSAERMVTTAARALGLESNVVRQKNFYTKGDVTPYAMPLKNFEMDKVYQKHLDSVEYNKRKQAVADFNKKNRWVKKGLTAVPSKFGVIYDGGATAFDCKLTVNRDGSVSVMTGGTEIGQGLTTKVTQTVAYRLGVPMSSVRILEHTTEVIGTTGAGDATGGSIGSELSCFAATNCCNEINNALAPVRKLLGPDADFKTVVAKAYEMGINLTVMKKDEGVAPPVNAIGDVYNTYGSVVIEVTVDILSGQLDIDYADITFDLGRSVNPMVDIGQIEGGFVMGLGLALVEDLKYTNEDGLVQSEEYYLPTRWEIPSTFNVTLLNGVKNPVTAGGGKAIGEPPVTLAYGVVEAAELALKAAAAETGEEARRAGEVPFNLERRNGAAANGYKNFRLQ